MSQLDYMARRVYEIAGWHTELYIDSVNLPDIAPVLAALPAVSADHLGLSQDGFHHLLTLVDQGIRVKATGFGRGRLASQKEMMDCLPGNNKNPWFPKGSVIVTALG